MLVVTYPDHATSSGGCRFCFKALGSPGILQSSRYGLCHGDLHKMNLLIDDQQRVTVIDWDCVGYGWRAYDVAVLRWSIGPAVGPAGIGKTKTEQVYAAYLDGYQSVRLLSPTEVAAIPYFVAVRIIWVAGQEIGQALERGWGTRWINDAYFDDWIDVLKRWIAEYGLFTSAAPL